MMNRFCISVIIPCYNCEDTIEGCLDSIDVGACNSEIIIVNDCSTDKSLLVINDYIKNNPDKNIKCFSNDDNLGAGGSRNRGIKESKGDYIIFLDADDCFVNNPITYFSSIIETNKYDCLIFNARFDTGKKMGMFFRKTNKAIQMNQKEALVYAKGCSCGKIYRASIIKENNVKFGNAKVNEDLVFTKTAISFCSSIKYVDEVFYLYKNNNNSLMHTTNRKEIADNYLIPSFQSLRASLSQKGFDKELNSIFYIEVLYSSSLSLFLSKEKRSIRKKTFRLQLKDYNSRDPYHHNYSFKYRIVVLFFKIIYWTFR